ncbi:MAG: hypothetical protein M0C28_23985 [Candidatus Moduliflexus flocculans]|nr:hypothetical protein [Candidatus Moduliflexus flocculans]
MPDPEDHRRLDPDVPRRRRHGGVRGRAPLDHPHAACRGLLRGGRHDRAGRGRECTPRASRPSTSTMWWSSSGRVRSAS